MEWLQGSAAALTCQFLMGMCLHKRSCIYTNAVTIGPGCRDASAALHHTPCLNGCLSMQQEVGQSQNWNTAVLHTLAHLEPPTP